MDEQQGGYARLEVVIRREMAERKMSIRQFADWTGISATTISKFIDKDEGDPSLRTLFQLSDAIKIDICTLLAIAFPERKISPSPRVSYILQRIDVLPDSERELIEKTVSVLLQLPSLSDEIKGFLRILGGY